MFPGDLFIDRIKRVYLVLSVVDATGGMCRNHQAARFMNVSFLTNESNKTSLFRRTLIMFDGETDTEFTGRFERNYGAKLVSKREVL